MRKHFENNHNYFKAIEYCQKEARLHWDSREQGTYVPVEGEFAGFSNISCGTHYDRPLKQQKEKIACEQGDGHACAQFAFGLRQGFSFFSQGECYYDTNKFCLSKQDYPQAILYYTKGCDAGYALACYDLANLYVEDSPSTAKPSTKKDTQQALYYAKKGCDMDNGMKNKLAAVPCGQLGYFYRNGLVMKDFEKMFKFFQKSCDLESGKNESCLELALLYLRGGVIEWNEHFDESILVPFKEKNEEKAIYYFERYNVCGGFSSPYCEDYLKLKKKHKKGGNVNSH